MALINDCCQVYKSVITTFLISLSNLLQFVHKGKVIRITSFAACGYILPQSQPLQQFQILLTPFAGSFASFPCGTCSLSGSCQYLALGGAFHPHSDCSIKQSYSKTSPLYVLDNSLLSCTGYVRDFHPLWLNHSMYTFIWLPLDCPWGIL